MSILIDFILIAILALCVWNGYRKGLILGIAGLLVLVVAFVGANLLAKTYSSEFMPIVEPIFDKIVDNAVLEAENSEAIVLKSDTIDEEEKTYITGVESLKNMGIFEKSAKKVIESIKNSADGFAKGLNNAIKTKLSETCCFLIVFIIAFLLIVIVFTIIANIVNLVFKLPGLELVNDIGGAVMGAAKGLVFVFVIALLMQYIGFAFQKSNAINKTILLKWLMQINPLSSIFGL